MLSQAGIDVNVSNKSEDDGGSDKVFFFNSFTNLIHFNNNFLTVCCAYMYNSQCRCRFKLRRQHHFLLQLLDIIIVILRKLSHSFLLAYDDDDKNEFFEYMQKKDHVY